MVYAGRLRLCALKDRGQGEILPFVINNITKEAIVRTDGYSGYSSLLDLGFRHQPLPINGDFERADGHLPMIHLVFSNLKTWILGTHHGAIAQHHLQAYLNEYVYRFNRRFYPMTAFNSVLGLAAHTKSPTYKDLYSGEWKHPY